MTTFCQSIDRLDIQVLVDYDVADSLSSRTPAFVTREWVDAAPAGLRGFRPESSLCC